MAVTKEEMDELMFSKYFSPTKGAQYKLVISNWRIENREFKESEGAKRVLVMDVLKINEQEIAANPKEWATKARSAIEPLTKIILQAQEQNKIAACVLVKYENERWTVFAMPDEVKEDD